MSSTKRKKKLNPLHQPTSCFYLTSVPTVSLGKSSSHSNSIPNTTSVWPHMCHREHTAVATSQLSQSPRQRTLLFVTQACFKLNRHSLQLLLETHKGLLAKAISHSLGKHRHTPTPSHSLPLFFTFPSRLHKQALPYPFFRTAKNVPSTEAKAHTNLSPPKRSPMLGPTCPPALSGRFSPPPLVQGQTEARAGAASCIFSSCWKKLQRKEGHVGQIPFCLPY